MVDDEPNILQTLKRRLRREPFQIVSAGSGAEGLKLIAGTPDVAVIISEQRMPEMNGSEFLARSRELAPDTIRILLTGYLHKLEKDGVTELQRIEQIMQYEELMEQRKQNINLLAAQKD